jgi:hypothetical protein
MGITFSIEKTSYYMCRFLHLSYIRNKLLSLRSWMHTRKGENCTTQFDALQPYNLLGCKYVFFHVYPDKSCIYKHPKQRDLTDNTRIKSLTVFLMVTYTGETFPVEL